MPFSILALRRNVPILHARILILSAEIGIFGVYGETTLTIAIYPPRKE